MASRSLDILDRQIAGWMERHGRPYLRLSLGAVYVWFGALKIIGLSPAEDLVRRTVTWWAPELFVPFLGWWEVAIGVGLLYRPLIRLAILLLFLQMPGTVLPLFLLPELTWIRPGWAPTLEGQYIIKNLVLISAALVVGGTVRHPSDDA
ncbi:MAG TPA: hypothetical protein VEI97_07495 [bacterium]|nr:hypothetical protein [bacterium]